MSDSNWNKVQKSDRRKTSEERERKQQEWKQEQQQLIEKHKPQHQKKKERKQHAEGTSSGKFVAAAPAKALKYSTTATTAIGSNSGTGSSATAAVARQAAPLQVADNLYDAFDYMEERERQKEQNVREARERMERERQELLMPINPKKPAKSKSSSSQQQQQQQKQKTVKSKKPSYKKVLRELKVEDVAVQLQQIEAKYPENEVAQMQMVADLLMTSFQQVDSQSCKASSTDTEEIMKFPYSHWSTRNAVVMDRLSRFFNEKNADDIQHFLFFVIDTYMAELSRGGHSSAKMRTNSNIMIFSLLVQFCVRAEPYALSTELLIQHGHIDSLVKIGAGVPLLQLEWLVWIITQVHSQQHHGNVMALKLWRDLLLARVNAESKVEVLRAVFAPLPYLLGNGTADQLKQVDGPVEFLDAALLQSLLRIYCKSCTATSTSTSSSTSAGPSGVILSDATFSQLLSLSLRYSSNSPRKYFLPLLSNVNKPELMELSLVLLAVSLSEDSHCFTNWTSLLNDWAPQLSNLIYFMSLYWRRTKPSASTASTQNSSSSSTSDSSSMPVKESTFQLLKTFAGKETLQSLLNRKLVVQSVQSVSKEIVARLGAEASGTMKESTAQQLQACQSSCQVLLKRVGSTAGTGGGLLSGGSKCMNGFMIFIAFALLLSALFLIYLTFCNNQNCRSAYCLPEACDYDPLKYLEQLSDLQHSSQ